MDHIQQNGIHSTVGTLTSIDCMLQQTQYLLYDIRTSYVITSTTVPAVAYALVEGFVDLEIVPVQKVNTESSKLLKDLHSNNFNIESILQSRNIKVNVRYRSWIEIDPSIDIASPPSDEIKEIVRITNLRKDFLTRFHYYQSCIQRRYCISFDLNFMNSLGQALSEGKDHFLIEEYARVTKITKDAAYNELKMKHESYMLQSMRFYASFEMFKNRINTAVTQEECRTIYWDMVENAYMQF